MQRNCPNCGENIDYVSGFCPFCGKSITQINRSDLVYTRFSTVSLIIGCLEIGLFSWFSISADYIFTGMDKTAAKIVFIVLNSLFLISVLVGLIFGSISIKKGKRKRAILGIVFNSLGVLLHLFVTIAFIILALDPATTF